jgi:hypothetical protein
VIIAEREDPDGAGESHPEFYPKGELRATGPGSHSFPVNLEDALVNSHRYLYIIPLTTEQQTQLKTGGMTLKLPTEERVSNRLEHVIE